MSASSRVSRLVRNPDLDLWILVAVAGVASFLSFFGWAPQEVVFGVILAVLAALCFSQIRTRHRLDHSGILHWTFPAGYFERRKSVQQSYLYIGHTMDRTLSTMRSEILRLLDQGGSVRVLLPDPDDGHLIEMIAGGRRNAASAADTEQSIRRSLTVLSQMSGNVQVRLLDRDPRLSLNAVDSDRRDGALMVQHYEFCPVSEATPILYFTRAGQGDWYERYVGEAERLWKAGKSWEVGDWTGSGELESS